MYGTQRCRWRSWSRFAFRCPIALLVVALVWPAACTSPCQSVSYRVIDLRCDPLVGFSGEIHFDNRASFDTFLRSQCLLPDDDVRIESALAAVDFSHEALFVAVRPMIAGNGTCLLERNVDDVAICDDGLNVIFADEYYSDPSSCPNGNWTVAFALARDDMRTALRLVGDE